MRPWFTVDEIDPQTHIISEYRHWEETHCYLLEGSDRALLIDTGLGICDISVEVRKLTNKPVTAVATHIHGDHIGGHKYSPDFYVHAAELAWLSGEFPLGMETIREMALDRCDPPEGGCVSYHTENLRIENGYVSADYIISDTGIGMSEAFLQKAFEPFTQENTGATAHLQGAGLGLAITKRLTELLGGSISIKSEPGKGTSVTIRLRSEIVPQAEQTPNAETVSNDDTTNLIGKRILLVEDNPINQLISMKLLERKRMHVITADNGQIGVERFTVSSAGYFDAILMDIRMPVMDGLEATRAIRALDRADAKTIPIIALSANAYEEDEQAAREAGITDYLTKPVDMSLLYDTLLRYMNA